MLLLLVTYWRPLAWFLFYASGPFFVVFSIFALKRGIQHRKTELRQHAIFTMFGAVLKMCLIDVRMLAENIKGAACFAGVFPGLDCSVKSISLHETNILSFYGIVVLCGACLVLFNLYRNYLPDRKPLECTLEQVHLKFWVTITLWSTILMALWGIAPWLGALLDAPLPRVFLEINWKTLGVINLCLLVVDFWKVESIIWENKMSDSKELKAKRTHLQQTWTPKDTLWMTVFLYLLVCALSYVGNDVLTVKKNDNEVHRRFHLSDYVPDVDISNPGAKGN